MTSVAAACGARAALHRLPSQRGADGRAAARGRLRRDSRRALRTGRRPARAGLSAGAGRARARRFAVVSLWWQIQINPESRLLDRQFSSSRLRPSPPTRPGPGASRSALKPGSISPGRTRHSCSGGCCAASGSARRATARRSRTRSSAPSQLDPDAARRVLRHRPLSLLRRRRAGRREDAAMAAACSPAAIASRDCARCCRRATGELLQGRSRLPAPPRLSVVRTQDRATRSNLLEAARRPLPAQPAVPSAHRRSPRRLPPRSRGERRRVADAARTRARRHVVLAATTEVRARLGLASVLAAMNRTRRDRRASARRRHASERADRRTRARGT